jgi:hypothetical protein
MVVNDNELVSNNSNGESQLNPDSKDNEDEKGRYSVYQELGAVGQYRYAGVFFEEFLDELKGRKGIKTYKEMTNNDDVVFAVDRLIELMIRQATFDVEPASEESIDIEAAQFLKECMDDLNKPFIDFIAEVLSFLDYGWSYFEKVFKVRRGDHPDLKMNSKYDDGLIGWRKLPIRSQDSLYEWVMDESTDELTGMTQLPPPSYQLKTIPLSKALHFRTTSIKDNPEGRSIWRGAYESYYYKKNLKVIEGIGIERDLAGLPVLQAPENTNIWDKNSTKMVEYLTNAKSIVQNIRRDKIEGIVIPFGWSLVLLSSGGSKQIDTDKIIQRYDTRIAMNGFADMILLGHQQVGSYALASSKTNTFGVAIGAYLDIICQTLNSQGVPQLFKLNENHFKGIKSYPKIIHGDVEVPDLQELASWLSVLISSGVIIPGPKLEQWAKMISGLPQEEESYEEQVNQQKQDMQAQQNTTAMDDLSNKAKLQQQQLDQKEAAKNPVNSKNNPKANQKQPTNKKRYLTFGSYLKV